MKNTLLIIAASLLAFSCKAETPTDNSSINVSNEVKEAVVSESTPSVVVEDDMTLDTSVKEERVEEKVVTEKSIPSKRVEQVIIDNNESTEALTAQIVEVVEEEMIAAEVTDQETLTQGTTAPAVIEEVEEVEVEQETTTVVEEKEEEPVEVVAIHDVWNTLLQTHVSSSGKVNYSGLKSEISKLDGYLADLSANVPSESDLSAEAKAYWMNAYNAFTVKLILNNYPVNSITDLHGGKPWDQKWIKLGGKTYSFNNIEHDILRPKFKDGRVHFAVNCAAKSCPKLSNKAFTAANSESLLNNLTKAFVNNAAANTINSSSIQLSKIFEWYGEDFGDLITFLNKYSSVKIDTNAAISFRDYDWALNSK